MAKLVLKFDDRVLQESAVGPQGVKIGRLPDNTLVIDNPAVSGHHARVVPEGGSYVLEDLQSTNGTFVNQKPITRHTLHDGDIVLIGKHTIEFDLLADDQAAAVSEARPSVPDLGGTRMLETEQHKALLAKWEKEAQNKITSAVPAAGSAPPGPAAPGMGTVKSERLAALSSTGTTKTDKPLVPPKVGVLHVLAGSADQSEYTITANTALIGKADTALVRLKGWFKPNVAVAIARKGDSYAATALGGKPLINGQRLTGRQDLRDGDVIEVSGLTLEFRVK